MSSKELAKVAAAQQKQTPDTLAAALKSGNPIVLASFLVMGLGNIAAGQVIKGLIFLAIEVGFIVYMAVPMGGAYWLSMLPGLGEVSGSRSLTKRKASSSICPVTGLSRSCCTPSPHW